MNNVKVKLKDIVTVKNGSTPSTSNPNYYDGEIIWITPKDLSNQNSRYVWKGERTITNDGLSSCSSTLLPKGTVLMSSRAPIGLLSIAATELCTNQGFKNFIPNTNVINSEFLYYYLKTKIHDIEKLGSGTTFKEVSKSSIENFELTIPKDINDQYKISTILSSLDSKIELNNRINAELEAMAKTLYDYWFVQFDFPDKNGKPYKSSGGKMVWNEKLKREIPEGWEVKRLEDSMRIVRGASPRPIDDYMSSTGSPWIKISDATSIDHWFITETKEFIKEEGVKHSRELQPGTLILSNSASPGIPRIVQIRSCVHDGWLIIDSFKDGLYNEFMLFFFENFRSKILNMGSGSIFKNLKTEYIKDLRITLPPKDLLNSTQDVFKDIASQILNNVQQTQQLASLRDWLLPMLMNGQVKVH